jgi:hypothetical protein
VANFLRRYAALIGRAPRANLDSSASKRRGKKLNHSAAAFTLLFLQFIVFTVEMPFHDIAQETRSSQNPFQLLPHSLPFGSGSDIARRIPPNFSTV